MSFYTSKEKIEICVDISKKLKFFQNEKGICVNLFDESYTFVPKLKKIFADYINDTKDYSGTLEFEEIGKQISYHLPISTTKKAKFVIKVASS